jgi:hypothetical protein
MPKTVVILTVQDLRRALQKAEENGRSRVVFELQELAEGQVYNVRLLLSQVLSAKWSDLTQWGQPNGVRLR